jgi:hypothetical protein
MSRPGSSGVRLVGLAQVYDKARSVFRAGGVDPVWLSWLLCVLNTCRISLDAIWMVSFHVVDTTINYCLVHHQVKPIGQIWARIYYIVFDTPGDYTDLHPLR